MTAQQWPVGYRINPRVASLCAELVEAFRAIPVAVAGDCMGRSIGARGLRAYHGDLALKLCGPAFTVRVRPGDNLMVHKALMMVRPGDVLVIDGGGRRQPGGHRRPGAHHGFAGEAGRYRHRRRRARP